MTTLNTLLLFGFLLCAGIGLTVGAATNMDLIAWEWAPQ